MIAYTLFATVIAVVWLVKGGPKNFLWFSDIAMFGIVAALWLGSALVASMMAVGVLLPEAIWNLSLLGHLVTRHRFIGLADYMFDREQSRFGRGLSLLLHVTLPPMLLFLVARFGYDGRALLAETVLAWIVLPVTYLITDPDKDINWVFGPGGRPQHRLPPLLYLALLMIVLPLVIFLPTHLLLRAVF